MAPESLDHKLSVKRHADNNYIKFIFLFGFLFFFNIMFYCYVKNLNNIHDFNFALN